jgi:hypothetical protein
MGNTIFEISILFELIQDLQKIHHNPSLLDLLLELNIISGRDLSREKREIQWAEVI